MKSKSLLIITLLTSTLFCLSQINETKILSYSRLLPDSVTEERIIIDFNKNTMSGILESSEYHLFKHSYLVGNVVGNIINGYMIYETYVGRETKYYQNKFSIEISEDKSMITMCKILDDGQKSKVVEYSSNQFADYGLAPFGIKYLKELPSIESKSLMKLEMLKLFQTKEIEFIEIGKIDKIENEINFWHKVKIKSAGFLGLLIFFKTDILWINELKLLLDIVF